MEKVVSIPKELSKKGELVIIPKKEYEKLLKERKVNAQDILRWTHEAKSLLRNGRLPKLNF